MFEYAEPVDEAPNRSLAAWWNGRGGDDERDVWLTDVAGGRRYVVERFTGGHFTGPGYRRFERATEAEARALFDAIVAAGGEIEPVE